MKLITALFTLLLSLMVFPLESAAQWTNFQAADNVLGQPNFFTDSVGTGLNQMFTPTKAVVDPATGKIFIAQLNSNRILRFASTAAMINGASAEVFFGGSGFPPGNATFNGPQGIAIDASGRLWVADRFNNRILRFDNAATASNSPAANAVLGQTDFITSTAGTAQNKLRQPTDISFDAFGSMWITDGANNRVLRFDRPASKANGANADAVFGQEDFDSFAEAAGAHGMRFPISVFADRDGRLWVSDSSNNRILRFDNAAAKSNGAAADAVLGQPDFMASAPGVSATQMYHPLGLWLDTSKRLYVVDYNNHRVLIFNTAPSLANGAAASNVLGQPDFTTGTQNNGGLSARSLLQPAYAVFVQSLRSLFVADNNHRVLRYTLGGALPTTVSVSGRIFSNSGYPYGATVTLTDAQSANVRTARVNYFGFYKFDGVTAGQTYTIRAFAKGKTFNAKTIMINLTVDDLDFAAN